jgi:hypothetical protein
MKIISAFITLFSILFLSSCERSVDFKLDSVEPKLVVEASIENGQAPVVYLSKSINYFSKIDQNILAASFVHNADIYVSNETSTHKLKEYSLPVGGGYNFLLLQQRSFVSSNGI